MSTNEQIRRIASLDLAQLEADVAASLPNGASLPSVRAPSVQTGSSMPDYVEHQDGVPRVGALSAEAVVREYEAAAKEIEAMGTELIGAAQKCEAMTADVHKAIAFMHETAAAYREEAKKIFKRIEDCALLTDDVRKTCETLKRKIEDTALAVH
jgi:hypothetical protein